VARTAALVLTDRPPTGSRTHHYTSRRTNTRSPEVPMDRPLATDVESPDVEALLAHPRMRELLAARRRFFLVAWTIFLAAAVLLFGGAAVAPGALGVALVDGVSVGVVLSCAFVVLIFALTVAYARRA